MQVSVADTENPERAIMEEAHIEEAHPPRSARISAESPQGPLPEAPQTSEYERYRALSTPAVVSVAVGLLSVLAFFSWSLGALPILGMALGLRAVRQIRARPQELTGLAVARTGVILCAAMLTGGWGYQAYVYATEVPENYVRLHYDDLQADLQTPNALPSSRALELNGKKVFVKGYMHPQFHSSKRVLLCRDSGDCCFGGKPALADMILVDFKRPLKAPDYTTWQTKLGGTLRVRAAKAAGVGGVIYHLEADYVP